MSSPVGPQQRPEGLRRQLEGDVGAGEAQRRRQGVAGLGGHPLDVVGGGAGVLLVHRQRQRLLAPGGQRGAQLLLGALAVQGAAGQRRLGGDLGALDGQGSDERLAVDRPADRVDERAQALALDLDGELDRGAAAQQRAQHLVGAAAAAGRQSAVDGGVEVGLDAEVLALRREGQLLVDQLERAGGRLGHQAAEAGPDVGLAQPADVDAGDRGAGQGLAGADRDHGAHAQGRRAEDRESGQGGRAGAHAGVSVCSGGLVVGVRLGSLPRSVRRCADDR
jgi:hypothetical protein